MLHSQVPNGWRILFCSCPSSSEFAPCYEKSVTAKCYLLSLECWDWSKGLAEALHPPAPHDPHQAQCHLGKCISCRYGGALIWLLKIISSKTINISGKLSKILFLSSSSAQAGVSCSETLKELIYASYQQEPQSQIPPPSKVSQPPAFPYQDAVLVWPLTHWQGGSYTNQSTENRGRE